MMCGAMLRTHASRLGALLLLVSSMASSQATLAATPCEKYAQREASMVSDPAITETSGLAVSHQHPGVIWLHNDSGDTARLFAVEIASGEKLIELEIVGIDARDWEDLALAPCSRETPDTDCLFIADIGNNNLDRTDLVIHRVQEPAQLGVPGTPLILTAAPLDSYPITYPFADMASEAPLIPDAEAFAIDRLSHRAFIWTKENARTRVMMLPDWATTIDTPQPLVYLGEAPVGLITGADIGPHGDRFALRAYGPFYEFASGVDAFLADPQHTPLPQFTIKKNVAGELQGEAIAYADSPSAALPSVLYTLAEGSRQKLSSFECVEPEPQGSLDMGSDSGHDGGAEEMGSPVTGMEPLEDMSPGEPGGDMRDATGERSDGGCAVSSTSPERPLSGALFSLLTALLGALTLFKRHPRRDLS